MLLLGGAAGKFAERMMQGGGFPAPAGLPPPGVASNLDAPQSDPAEPSRWERLARLGDPVAIREKLRADGFPEPTIAGAIYGAVLAKYDFTTLRDRANGWDRSSRTQEEYRTMDAVVHAEFQALLPAGYDGLQSPEARKSDTDGRNRIRYGALSEEKIMAVQRIEAALKEILHPTAPEAAAGGNFQLPLDTDWPRLSAADRREGMERIREVLSPDEAEDYELFNTTKDLQGMLVNLRVDEATYRALAREQLAWRSVESIDPGRNVDRLERFRSILGDESFLKTLIDYTAIRPVDISAGYKLPGDPGTATIADRFLRSIEVPAAARAQVIVNLARLAAKPGSLSTRERRSEAFAAIVETAGLTAEQAEALKADRAGQYLLR